MRPRIEGNPINVLVKDLSKFDEDDIANVHMYKFEPFKERTDPFLPPDYTVN